MKLLKFKAEWCGPCKIMSPVVEKIAEKYDLKVVEIDADENFKKLERWNVQTIPTVLLVHRGEEIGRVIGAKTFAQTEEGLMLELEI